MDREERLVNAAIRTWTSAVTDVGDWLASRTEEQLSIRLAPGRNSIRYLYGHLIAAHDIMGNVLGLGARRYEFLDAIFLSVPDGHATRYPNAGELARYWTQLHERLNRGMLQIRVDDWAQPHLGVSDADFQLRPWRNRYGVLLGRISHLSAHIGQLSLIDPSGTLAREEMSR